jgi:hypothetical protein
MPPLKSEEIPAFVREKVIKTHTTKKNSAELTRLFSIQKATIGSNENKMNFMEMLKIDLDLDEGHVTLCV